MKVGSISNFIPEVNKSIGVEKPRDKQFDNLLTNFIGDVNQSQLGANKLVEDFASGGNVQIQDVMIAGEKAKTSLQLLVEIRNKTLDMYKELTRTLP